MLVKPFSVHEGHLEVSPSFSSTYLQTTFATLELSTRIAISNETSTHTLAARMPNFKSSEDRAQPPLQPRIRAC